MYCISIREEGNSLPEGTATAAQQSRRPAAEGKLLLRVYLPRPVVGHRVAQATALPSRGEAEAPFGVVAVADQVLKTEHSSGYISISSKHVLCCIHVWRDHVSREHRTAAVGFHFGSRPHKRNYCFVLTSLVLGGLHQRSGVALPTGGRADPAIGNDALAGTRCYYYSFWM